MEATVDFLDLWVMFKKNIKTILVCTILGGIIATAITFLLLTPKYSSQSQIVASLPQQTNVSNSSNDINSNLQLINTYKELVTGDVVLKEANKELSAKGIERSISQLKDEITVSQPQNSLLFTVKTVDKSAVDAMYITNTVSSVFKKNVHKYLNVEKITIVSKGTINNNKVSPRNSLNIMIGLVLGILLGIGISFIKELMDTTVKDEKYVTDELGLTVLGRISKMSASELKGSTNKVAKISVNKKSNTPKRSGRNI